MSRRGTYLPVRGPDSVTDTMTEAADPPHLPSYVRLANEIAVQFPQLSEDDAADAVAAHIRRFWDPRMRAGLHKHLAAGGADLLPISRAAATLLDSGSGRLGIHARRTPGKCAFSGIPHDY